MIILPGKLIPKYWIFGGISFHVHQQEYLNWQSTGLWTARSWVQIYQQVLEVTLGSHSFTNYIGVQAGLALTWAIAVNCEEYYMQARAEYRQW